MALFSAFVSILTSLLFSFSAPIDFGDKELIELTELVDEVEELVESLLFKSVVTVIGLAGLVLAVVLLFLRTGFGFFWVFNFVAGFVLDVVAVVTFFVVDVDVEEGWVGAVPGLSFGFSFIFLELCPFELAGGATLDISRFS